MSALRFLQSDDSNHQSNGVHPWGDLQRKLRSSGLNIKYKTFKARWDDPTEGALLKQFVDRFDGNGIVLKNTQPGAELSTGNAPKTGEVSKMAKRATKLGK